MKLGDAMLALALLVWMSLSVGPWWVGLLLLVGAWALNLAEILLRRTNHGD
jgi:hypothetical protein